MYRDVAADPECLASMSRAARAVVENRDWTDVADCVGTVYERVCDGDTPS